MITKSFWKNIIKNIKEIKKTNPKYYKLEEEKTETTLIFIIIIIATPLFLLFDLFVLPFELLYLIVYKLLWRR